jgi:hypothetical protein
MMLWTRITDHSSKGRLATIGMTFNYRYAPTNFSDAAFIDVFDEETTELAVNLTFLADYDGDLDVDWMDGAKFLRDQVQVTPEPRYVSSFITKKGPVGIELITDHLLTIRKLYHLTDHNKTYAYLTGHISQVFGEESDLLSNPSLFILYEDLRRLFLEAEDSYNTYLSFDDNYTHYIAGTLGYDPNCRVIGPDGLPLVDSDAFIADPYDYVMNVGMNRVQKTLDYYPIIKESYHIDVLSVVFPKDYSQGSPSSRERNRRGIQLIINEFNEYKGRGVNVTSEGLTGQLVESGIGWFLHIPWHILSKLPFGNEEFIPLLAFVYHGKTLYGLTEWDLSDLPSAQVSIYAFLEPLLLGASSGAHITWSSADDLEFNKFYLIDLPWMALNQRFMLDYQEQSSRRRIAYDKDTFVEVDYEQDTYTVQVDGRIIAETYTTCFPKSENRFLIFSRDEKEISVILPQKWPDEERIIELHELTEEGLGDTIPFQISFDNLTFHAEANTPYRLDWVTEISTPLGTNASVSNTCRVEN